MEKEAVLDKNRKVVRELRRKIAARNKPSDIQALMDKYGLTIEYNEDEDCLYLSYGEPRESMALTVGEALVMVDPDTLEITGWDAPFFMEKIRDGRLQGFWLEIAKWVQNRGEGKIYVPPKHELKESSEKLARILEPTLS